MKIPQWLKEFEQMWHEDDFDCGWFVTSHDFNKWTPRDGKMFLKGAKGMLQEIKNHVKHEPHS